MNDREELGGDALITILNEIETTAFHMPPPNVWTPTIVGLVIAARNIVYETMRRDHERIASEGIRPGEA